MRVANENYDFSYKTHIANILRKGEIEEPIRDVVEQMNTYEWCMTVGSCGGHESRIDINWEYAVVYGITSEKHPYISFVVKDKKFLDFLIEKRKQYDNVQMQFHIYVEVLDTIVKEWVDVDAQIPVINVKFHPMPHNIGWGKNKRCIDNSTKRVAYVNIFIGMKELFLSGCEEFNEKYYLRIE